MLLQMALFHSLHGWLSNIPLCIYIYTTSSLSIPLLPTSNLTAPLALRGFSSGANAEESAYQCRRHKRCGHVQSLGWEDPLEEGMATHFILAWRIPQTEEPGGL